MNACSSGPISTSSGIHRRIRFPAGFVQVIPSVNT